MPRKYVCFEFAALYIVKRVLFLLQAFFAGKLKLAGNTAAAMKLQAIMPSPVKAKL